MTAKQSEFGSWAFMLVGSATAVWAVFGCAFRVPITTEVKGVDASETTTTEQPVKITATGDVASTVEASEDKIGGPIDITAGRDVTVFTLGRMGGAGLCCLPLVALLFSWRRAHVATRALDRVVTAIEEEHIYFKTPGSAAAAAAALACLKTRIANPGWAFKGEPLESGITPVVYDALEHLIRKRLARMKK